MTEQEKQFKTLRKRLFISTSTDSYVILSDLIFRLFQITLSPGLSQEERKSASSHLSFIEECFDELSNISLKIA